MIVFNPMQTQIHEQLSDHDYHAREHPLKDIIMKDQPTMRPSLFDLQKGEILGIFGPSGSGKSTLLGILNCLRQQEFPGAEMLDAKDNPLNDRGARAVSNKWIDYSNSPLSVMEALLDALDSASIKSRLARTRYKQALAYLALEGEVMVKPLSQASRTMLTKLDLMKALVNPPDILLLEEPTAGLSDQSKDEIYGLLEQLKAFGNTTILLSTQDPFEAETFCDRIVLVSHGRVVACGRVEQLKRMLGPERTDDHMLTTLFDLLTSEATFVY